MSAGETVRVEIPVLGVPVRFELPARLVEPVARHFGGERDRRPAAEVGPGGSTVPVVRIELGDGRLPRDASDPPALRFETMSPTRLRMVGEGVDAEADAARGRARAVLHPATTEDPETFGHGVLRTLVLFLVTARDRLPVHAAAVWVGGRALLLAAAGGTGKSTLAYALLRGGADVLADDAVYLQSSPRLAVWAMGARISLPEDARARFPELAGVPATRRADGRTRILVPLSGGEGHRRGVEPRGICLLVREVTGAGTIERLEPAAVVDVVAAELAPGFDRFADTMRAPLAAVARRGAWRVRLPPDACRAADLVRTLAD